MGVDLEGGLPEYSGSVQGMKVIDKYIGRQVLSSTLFGVGVLSLVLVLGNIFKELIPELVKRPDMDLKYVFRFILNVLPYSLIFTIPWGMLTAVLLVFGRLSADNELTSLRMAGLSMTRLCLPVLLIGSVLTASCLWLGVSVSPKAKKNLKGMVLQLAIENPTALFNSDQVIDEIPGYVMYVEEKAYSDDGSNPVLLNMQIVELGPKREPIRYVKAERVKMRTEEADGELRIVLDLEQARFESKKEEDPLDYEGINLGFAESTPLVISLDKLKKNYSRINAGMMTIGEIREALASSETGPEKRASLKTEVSKRYSFSLACMTLGLIGIPLGVTAQRRETSIGFALSLMVACGYFALILLADSFRDNPNAHPHLLMWLPNLVFLSLGVWLFRRLGRA